VNSSRRWLVEEVELLAADLPCGLEEGRLSTQASAIAEHVNVDHDQIT
jgi:hypothetical protein